MTIRTSQRKLSNTVQLAALAASVLCASCELLLRFDDAQCSKDDDCIQRGLLEASCVKGLCQPHRAQRELTTSELPAASPSGSSTDDAEPATEEQHKERAQHADEQAQDAAVSGMPERSAQPPALHRVSTAGGGGAAAPTQSSAGRGGSTAPCSGAGCADCTVDADCDEHSKCVGSLCFPAQSECSHDMDCLSKGPEYEGGRCLESQCVPNPLWRCNVPPPARDTPAHDISLPVLDGLSRSTLSDLRVLVCPKLDLTCVKPVGEAMTDGKGVFHFTLPPNFNGYLLSEPRGYLPAMYFVPSHIPDDGVLDGFPMVGSGLSADALATSLGTTLDKERGHMMIIQKDCTENGVAGAAFSSPAQDAKSVLFYVYDQLPSASARVTSDTGQGGFLNLPAGTPTIEARLRDGDVLLSKTSVVIRAGYISVAFVSPLPR